MQDILHTVVTVDIDLCMFDLHQDTVHCLLTLEKICLFLERMNCP